MGWIYLAIFIAICIMCPVVIIPVIIFAVILLMLSLANKNNNVENMTGLEFESYVAYIFRRQGYNVITTPKTGDFGADLILTKPNERICVQCKRYKKPVGVSAVQEVATAKTYYDCEKAVVVTNSKFTKAANKLATANKVVLYDGNWIKKQC